MTGLYAAELGGRKGMGIGLAGTLVVHLAAGVMLLGIGTSERKVGPPVYRVELVAAPKPKPNARRRPETLERPAQQKPTLPKPSRRKTSVAEETPPPSAESIEREPAVKTTPDEAPPPDTKPSTGTDRTTVKTEGVEFPFPEYLRNIVRQIYRRWQRPGGNVKLSAEVLFFIRRDGSVSDIQFTKRSGNFAFDLEAEGAVEAAANSGAFGPLPDGFPSDILPVTFFFNPGSISQ